MGDDADQGRDRDAPSGRFWRSLGAADHEAAALSDPQAPTAADRLALLDWLVERGLTLEQLVRAQAEAPLAGLAADLALRGDGPLALAEIAAASGLLRAAEDAPEWCVSSRGPRAAVSGAAWIAWFTEGRMASR
jgi:hypothetical protein